VTGWLDEEDAWGRPNDVLVAPDGSLLISDDRTGQIFQVRFEGTGSTVASASP
jgi:glucose/arabinose dehydrogenase